MIDFSKYNVDYEVPLNPANFADFIGAKLNNRLTRAENFYMQADAYLECSDELAKWLHDNIRSANAFDYGIVIYLANHSVELKIKAILIKNGEQNFAGHDCVKLADKIPDECFCEEIDGVGKLALINNLKILNKYNTSQNELGRYTESKNKKRLAQNEDGEVFAHLMSMMYIYHQVIDLLNKNYKRINTENNQQ